MLAGSQPVIDLHCHVLAGIDDGPQTINDSVALASAAANLGTRTLVATPHVSWRYPNDPDTIARLVEELNARLAAEGVALEVIPGAEIAVAHVDDLEPASLWRLGLGDGKWLLLEPPFTSIATGMRSILLDLEDRGHHVILAHPERCPAFQRDPPLLESLVRGGILTSITAGSLVGKFGGEVRRFALRLVRDGLVHNVASDAHGHLQRTPGITAELGRAGLGPLTDWLTHAVPEAILGGGEIPTRPAVVLPELETARRSWWSRRR